MANKNTVALTLEQYKEVINTMRSGGAGFRPNDRIANCLVLEANLGLRIEDILSLHLCDIVKDGANYRLDIIEHKTKKKRTFIVPLQVYQFIYMYCVEITAWKKNCKPYGAKTIGKITRMGMRIQFDHAIELDKHYISPGGYIFVCNGKSYHFDFLDYEGSVDAEDPTILYAEVYHLDENYSNKLDDFVAEELTTIEEFYIYTGEGNDAEINPIAVLSLIIEQNGVTTEVDKKILKSIKF